MSESPCVDQRPRKRIVIVGSTASGKTTLAQQLSNLFDLPHIELDALHWDADWTPAPPDVFQQRVEAALPRDGWVVDGNYRKVRDLVWGRADTMVWLDYSLVVVFRRLVWRTMARVRSREDLWNGNHERFRDQFLSRESLFLWALKTHARRRREYSALFKSPEYAHLDVVQHRSPEETRVWLAKLRKQHG